MGGRNALALVLALWAGLLLGGRLDAAGVAAASAGAAALAAAAARLRGPAGAVALLLVLVVAGAARAGGERARLAAERAPLGSPGSESLRRLIGVVEAPPDVESGEALAVLAVTAAEPPLVAGTRLRLRLPAGVVPEWSDTLVALARLEVPLAARNPGGYDALAGAAVHRIAAVGKAFTAEARPAHGLAGWPRATAARWRRAIERRLVAGLGPRARELVVPLVLGDRTGVTPELGAELRASGLIHLFALSGLHVAWMSAVARVAAAALGLGLSARAAAGACCALFYVLIAGAIPSLVRAALTEGLGSLARATSRALDPLQALAWSAILALVAAPGWAGDVGFQLSCAATFGLVALAPRAPRAEPAQRALASAFGPTVGAQLGALPVLLARFHAASWVALVANLAAVPLTGALLAAAWLAVSLDAAAPGAGAVFFAACEALGAALALAVEHAARLPMALPAAGHGLAPAWLAAAGAVLLAAAREPRALDARAAATPRWRDAARLYGALACGLALLLVATTRPLLPPPGRYWLVALDVGQGDAIALAFADGWWLVDAGPRSPRHDAGESVVLPFLRWAGVRRLETLVVTHDDLDHRGGVPALRRGVAIGRRVGPVPHPSVPGPCARLGARPVARGDVLRRAPEVVARWPPRDAGEASIASDNAASLILEVGEGEGRSLLPGDADSTVEARLDVEPGLALLKVGHHGSASSSGATFLARARPRHAIVSCGRRNPFGHPAAGVLARLGAAGAAVHRTDLEGAQWFELSARGATRIDWRRGAPRDTTRARAPAWARSGAPRAP